MVKHYLLGLKWVTNIILINVLLGDGIILTDHPPFLEDVNNYIKDNPFKNFKFKIGKPLKPIVQLLCVLPPQSSYLLPKPIQKMMLNSNSTLAHLYPTDFEQDFIGKGKYWKAIPYLPPLEIDLVKRTFLKYEKKLSDSDKKKNRTIKIYKY